MLEQQRSRLWTVLTGAALLLIFVSLWRGFAALEYDWDFASLSEYIWLKEEQLPGLLITGLWGTLWVSALSICLGSVIGLCGGLILHSGNAFARSTIQVFVEIFRNTPVLVQLYVMYFVVASAFHMSAEQAGVATLSLFCGAYISELVRGTLLNLERGPQDAALSLGLTRWQTARHVVAPLALRRLMPSLVGQYVSLVKDSSLVSVISIVELTKSASNMVAISFKSFEVWFLVAVVYFMLNFMLSRIGQRIERRMSGDLHAA
ncbi:MAG: amino acid ABC transporter permease [Betaproteobacteria bacterium]|nr:amino acid ABC transporter permease [Betaproteobacteria bacterium]